MFKKQTRPQQQELWIRSDELRLPPEAPFWPKFQEFLDSLDFETKVRAACAPHYTPNGPGQPGVDPVVYFKMLLIAFFENIRSERGIEARCADSLSIRGFLGIGLTDRVPDHSTLSRIRYRLPAVVFDEVYGIIFPRLHELKLIRGKALGMDTSVIEADAAKKSLRNRMTREKYRAYVKRLAKHQGIDPVDEAAVSRFDRNREGRTTSNDEWENPHDPEAKIGPTKHGSTRMIYKPEHPRSLQKSEPWETSRRDASDCRVVSCDSQEHCRERVATISRDVYRAQLRSCARRRRNAPDDASWKRKHRETIQDCGTRV